jgi:hypothetical protein
LIYVGSDLLGAALGGDVLSLNQPRSPAVAPQGHEILGHHRNGPASAFLPRRVGRRVDDDLAHDPPAGVVRVAARHEKPRQRISYALGLRFGGMDVQMPKRGTNRPAFFHRFG